MSLSCAELGDVDHSRRTFLTPMAEKTIIWEFPFSSEWLSFPFCCIPHFLMLHIFSLSYMQMFFKRLSSMSSTYYWNTMLLLMLIWAVIGCCWCDMLVCFVRRISLWRWRRRTMNCTGSLSASDQYVYDKQRYCRNFTRNYTTNSKFRMVNDWMYSMQQSTPVEINQIYI